MALTPGTRLGPYEILAAIGAGGMGEVYRARDAKLGRDVALKVLPEAFARNPERMARFEREAKVLASLDHPNIASIYGLEDSGGTRALVMQLVEGPTLADRIRQGPIPVDEAVRIARQIADALEYAHERGIIHRDLKPANVKVTSNDSVKVLDFSLAKAVESSAASADLADSPTISQMATQQGTLLGTAAYMSPEQAKGKPVDRRADIWAFGCVLYEMLTGKKAFRGESVTDTLAAVIKEEPDWSRLPLSTPIRVRVLLLRCLQKDPKQRLRDIGDARIALDEAISGAPEDVPSLAAIGHPTLGTWRMWVVSSIAGVLLATTALFAFLYFHERPRAAEPVRFEIPLPPEFTGGGAFALSPDGRKLAFVAAGADGQNHLWVRTFDTLELRPLDGTEGASMYPVWSPDSRFIAFWAQGKLNKIEPSGGPPLAVCDTPAFVIGTWTRDDRILFGSPSGLMQVAASGGVPSLVAEGVSVSPSALPDGHHFVYLREDGDSGIYVGSLDAKPHEQTSRKLLPEFSRVAYASSPDPAVGYLLFVRGAARGVGALGTLMAQPFDVRRLALIGEASPIAGHVSNNGFSPSATDAVVGYGWTRRIWIGEPGQHPRATDLVRPGRKGSWNGR
jgi:eukaryotic-like serine/threonine-protein kinase